MKTFIAFVLILCFLIFQIEESISSPRIELSIQNRRIVNTTFLADIVVNVPSQENKWLVTSSNIIISFNSEGLSLSNHNGIPAINLDEELLNAGYSVQQDRWSDKYLSLALFTSNPVVFKDGNFRLCTVQWKITNENKYDSLRFYPSLCEIFNGYILQLENGCNTEICYKTENPEPRILKNVLPVIFTSDITQITTSSAISGGNITNDGGSAILSRGICWAENPNPTILSSKTNDGNGTGTFISNLSGLEHNRFYYARAYATNQYGTEYGEQKAFKTKVQKPNLIFPSNNAVNISLSPTLTWSDVIRIDSFRLQLSTNNDFSSIFFNSIIKNQEQNIAGLSNLTSYYWRICSLSGNDSSEWSSIFKFTTIDTVKKEPPASWDFTDNTGNSATVVLLKSANPKIGDRDFSEGDAVGFFFKENGIEKCAGYSVWERKNLPITVWGDNEQTLEKDGFEINEKYIIKVWDAVEGKEYYADVRYSSGKDYYTVDGFSFISFLEAITDVTQVINFNLGWNMISSFVESEHNSMDSIWKDFKTNVSLVKNIAGNVYIPGYDINNIGDWNIKEGYQVFTTKQTKLEVTGKQIKPEETTFSLITGWSMISYLRNNALNSVNALKSLTDEEALLVAKNNLGKVYIPSYNINTLGNLIPGEGYKVYLTKNADLIYPANTLEKSNSSSYPEPKHLLSEFYNTGNNAIIIIKIDAENGSEAAVYTNYDRIAGSGVIINGYAAVTIWGDDDQTNETDGAISSEKLKVKSYNVKTGRLSEVNISGLIDMTNGSEVFGFNYSKDAVFFAKATVENNESNISLIVRPNPASEIIDIEIETPDCKATELKIYSMNGKLVKDLTAKLTESNSQIIKENIDNLTNGEYILTITTNNKQKSKRFVKIK